MIIVNGPRGQFYEHSLIFNVPEPECDSITGVLHKMPLLKAYSSKSLNTLQCIYLFH